MPVFAEHSSDDWQYWNEFIFEHDVTDRVSAELGIEQNFVGNFNEFFMYNYTLNLAYKFTESFKLGIEFKNEKEKGESHWPREYRTGLVPVYKCKLGGFGIKSKTKIEYRDFRGDRKWRVKEKVTVKKDLQVSGFKFSPYISEELYYSFQSDRVNQNRAAIGISKEVCSNLEVSLYYMNKAGRGEFSWYSANIIGTEVLVTF